MPERRIVPCDDEPPFSGFQHHFIVSTETTLITGASSGIGLHLAKEFARHGHPLVLIAPVAAELESIASDLKTAHGVEVRTIAADLRKPDGTDTIHEQLQGGGIDILVNNAGHGQKGKAWEIPLDEDLSMV